MKTKRLHFIYFFIMLLMSACSDNTTKGDLNPLTYSEAVGSLTAVLVHDIFSPPVASRNYAYPLIAGYETMRLEDAENYPSLLEILNEANPLISAPISAHINFSYASTLAFFLTARHFVFSESEINEAIQNLNQIFLVSKPSKKTIRDSQRLAEYVASHVIQWSDSDAYKQTRSFAKFTIDEKPFTWKPTPPAYMEGIEPHWREIRPFLLDSSAQFKPISPTFFDLNPNSQFYQELMEVYETVNQISENQLEIAHFWDCNPYKMNVTGHVMHATKKITPGGHWVNIAAIACDIANLNWIERTKVMAIVSMAIADAFIVCWDEKYRSILIRPESLINEYVDENWEPILQTPPFPEYPSGHSVVSTTAARILSSFFGETFYFDDDTEVVFGLPIRSFHSFNEAAEEAAISRLYGGIHYMPAIKNGQKQGNQVADYYIHKLNLSQVEINEKEQE